MLRHAVLVLLTVPMLSGCFSYVPIEAGTVAPGMNVRVHVTDGPREEVVEGKVFEIDLTSLSILPEVAPGSAGGPLSLAFADVDLLESRRLSPTRTMLLLGASVTIGVIAIFGVNGNSGSEGRLPGGPVFQRLPLFRLVLGH